MAISPGDQQHATAALYGAAISVTAKARRCQMALAITPSWDPTGTVSLRIDRARGTLVVRDDGEETRFRLRRDRPERLGWWRREGRSWVRASVARWSATASESGRPSRRCSP
jgi:hypothetical protein